MTDHARNICRWNLRTAAIGSTGPTNVGVALFFRDIPFATYSGQMFHYHGGMLRRRMMIVRQQGIFSTSRQRSGLWAGPTVVGSSSEASYVSLDHRLVPPCLIRKQRNKQASCDKIASEYVQLQVNSWRRKFSS